MTAEQLQQLFKLERQWGAEVCAFDNFIKHDTDICFLRKNEDSKSLTYGIYFRDKNGLTFKHEYESKEFMDHETVYEILKAKFLESYRADLRSSYEEDVLFYEKELQKAKTKLAELDEQI